MLSAALDEAAVALRDDLAPAGVMPKDLPPPLPRLRTLNPRHSQALLVAELAEGIATQVDGRTATVSFKGETRAALCLGLDEKWQEFWYDELRQVHDRKWQRDERLAEIYVQQTDLLSFFGLCVPLGPDTHPWTMALLEGINQVVFRVETAVKYGFSISRPVALSSRINPVIQTPAHSTFPSGHATESFAAAAVLGQLYFGCAQKDLRLTAARISANRVFAGVHFPVDNAAGAVLGSAIGEILLHRLTGVELGDAHRFAIDDDDDTYDDTDAYALQVPARPSISKDFQPPEILSLFMQQVRREIGALPAAAPPS